MAPLILACVQMFGMYENKLLDITCSDRVETSKFNLRPEKRQVFQPALCNNEINRQLFR